MILLQHASWAYLDPASWLTRTMRVGVRAPTTAMLIFHSILAVVAVGSVRVAHAAPLQIERPCDIYGAGRTPCVAAYSTTRALYVTYAGPLYRVTRRMDNKSIDIGVDVIGGHANASAQDLFCAGVGCVITSIYDQSPRGNHIAPPHHPTFRGKCDAGANATSAPLTVSGHHVYAVFIPGGGAPSGVQCTGRGEPGVGYRNDTTNGIPTGDAPESIYMVVAGGHYNGGCCFDFGNAEKGDADAGAGTMEAVSWTNGTWGMSHHGDGTGPWIMADLENGLWGDNTGNSKAPSMAGFDYVTAMVKGDSGNRWAVKGGDAGSVGSTLRTLFEGPRPCSAPLPPGCTRDLGYNPMRKQGSVILGVGGDNSHGGAGTFIEGAITVGYSTDDVDRAVHANIAAAGYGK